MPGSHRGGSMGRKRGRIGVRRADGGVRMADGRRTEVSLAR
jgi:hypothetical protein